MELVESNFELLSCGEPCTYLHPVPPMWTGKSINPKCILHTLVRIMKDPKSEDQIQRQLCLLEDLKCGLTHGFWLQDIEDVTKLIEILMCRGEMMPVFVNYAIYLICLMRFPPLMCRTNEILEYSRDAQGYFDFFGYILVTTPTLIVRQIILQSLKTLLQNNAILKDYSMPWEMMTKEIEQSNLPLILSQYMGLCCEKMYFDLVEIMQTFANFSETMRMTLVKDGCLQIVMMRLNPDWQEHLGGPRPQFELKQMNREYPIDESIMLIHALLHTYQEQKDNLTNEQVVCPTVEAVWGLRFVLQLCTLDKRYINERNFVASLCLLFVECFPEGKHVQSGIVHDFALLSTIGDAPIAANSYFNLHESDDFEFKKMMMLGLILYNDCLGSKEIYQDADVIPALSRLLDKTTNWASQFHDSLLLTAIYVLQNIFPSHIITFLVTNGPSLVIQILEELVLQENCIPKYEICIQCLRFSYKMIKTFMENKSLSSKWCNEHYKLQRNILKRLFDMDLKLKTQKIMTLSLNILSLLPDNECAADVEFVVALLKRFLNPRTTDLGYIERLFIAAISLLWKHGLHNEVNILYFVKLKGIYFLLDLIKGADFSVQLVTLGFLVDVIQEGTAIPYIVTWQKDGVGILALLINIFRKECKDIGVDLLPRGVIADPNHPLMGRIQKQLFLSNNYSPETSPSLTDLFLSCRPKIYAIFQLLHRNHGATLELVNEYYKTYDTNLSTDDKITRILCENYYNLKLGEMWSEVNQEVDAFAPSPHHKFMLDTLLAHFLNCGHKTQKLQRNLLVIERKNEHIEEEEFYNQLRETKLGPAIQGYKEMKFMARTNIGRSHASVSERTSARCVVETHRTVTEDFTVFQPIGQKIVIQSDVILDPFAPIPPKLVSEDDDDRISIYDENVSEISLALNIDCKEFKCEELENCEKRKIKKKAPLKKTKPKHKSKKNVAQ